MADTYQPEQDFKPSPLLPHAAQLGCSFASMLGPYYLREGIFSPTSSAGDCGGDVLIRVLISSLLKIGTSAQDMDYDRTTAQGNKAEL